MKNLCLYNVIIHTKFTIGFLYKKDIKTEFFVLNNPINNLLQLFCFLGERGREDLNGNCCISNLNKYNSASIEEILHQNQNKGIRITQLAKITPLFHDWWSSLNFISNYLTSQKGRGTCTVITKMPRKMLIYFKIPFASINKLISVKIELI